MDKLNFHTPVGRFINGSLTEKRSTDSNNRPIEPEKQRYEFGLAIAKTDPAVGALLQSFGGHALQGYASAPHVQQRIQAWFTNGMTGFSMKVSDGDKPNQNGRVNQNSVGCYVIWFSTAMEINGANAQNTQIDLNAIKRGYYVDVAGSTDVNGLLDHNAGIYMNAGWVRLVGEGDVITGGMSVEDAFGAAPAPALPPGARAVGSTPQVPVGSGAPGTTGVVGNMPPAMALPEIGGQTAPVGQVAAAAAPAGTVSLGEPQSYPGVLTVPGLPG